MDQTTEKTPLTLQPPAPVEQVTPERAIQAVPISPQDQQALDTKVDGAVDGLVSLEIHGDDFRKTIESIAHIGDADIAESASTSNRLLDKPMREMQQGGISEGSTVSKNLLALRRVIEGLDPSKRNLLAPSRILGIFPGGNKAVDYFRSYQSGQKQINSIAESLLQGRDELMRDNATIEEQKAKTWSLMQRLQKYGYIAQKIDETLSAKIAQIATTDPERAKILQEEVLFRLRQKRQDIATQMAVNVQGYMTMDLVRRNNEELIEGVRRATTTTLSALQTAVMAAQALTDQKLVLDQITALSSTTNNLILATSQMLGQNSAKIAEMASNPTVAVETLQKAFDNIFATLDQVDTYKIKALDSMKVTVDGLQTQISRANTYLDKERQVAIATSGTALPKSADLTIE